jgi:hypothetical protein
MAKLALLPLLAVACSEADPPLAAGASTAVVTARPARPALDP